MIKRVYSILLLSFILMSCSYKILKPKSIDNIIDSMTLEEKIDFIGGYKSFRIRGFDHHGIPEILFADGPVGVRDHGESTAYPAGINLAASFDKELAYNIGKAIGSEACEKNVHVMLGPAMNIYRLPLCGRNFEYLGEDPFLAGQMAKEYIIGLQEQGVMATAKHYVANNQEYDRHRVSSDLDERTLHEIYLPAFKAAVQDGNVAAIMTSYNPINGIHASQHNYLNNEILKGIWRFKGFIMSDWSSTYDGLAAANGGLDLEMPSGKFMNTGNLLAAVESGDLRESVIDDKIKRILKGYERFGFFENPDISAGYVLDEDFVRLTALNAARGGMVLLKNDALLPLDKTKIKSIAIIGPNGHPAKPGGGGSSRVDPLYPLSLFEAVKEIAPEKTEVVFEKGIFTGFEFPEGMFEEFDFYVYNDGEKVTGINAEYFNGKKLQGPVTLSKFYQKLDLENEDMWDLPGVPETNYSARFTCNYSPEETGRYSFGISGDDGYRLFIDDQMVLEQWRNQADTPAQYDVLLNAGQEYKVVLEYYQGPGVATIRLGATKINIDVQPNQYEAMALDAAKKADLVIMSVGFDHSNEGEGFDRTFKMPFEQGELINKIAAVNKNIVVVLNAGGNVEMESWIDNTKALLMAWYPGQEGNRAAAEILFGSTNPAGKLPVSFAKTIEQNPAYKHYFDDDEDLKVYYGEGIFMGYRYWDKSNVEPRFPFGFGLSYTEFEYSGIYTSKNEYTKNELVTVSLNVQNSGNFDGSEIVQVYIADKESSLPRPVKELKDFEKIHLKKGEEKKVSFELNKEAFAFYNPQRHEWIVEPGEFDILVGSSSADIKQSVSIIIK